MYYFTVMQISQEFHLCPVDEDGNFGDDFPVMKILHHDSQHVVVATEGGSALFHINKIVRGDAWTPVISGYCVEGGD